MLQFKEMIVLEEYKTRLSRGERYVGFWIALNWFLQMGGKEIVETGCVRLADDFEGAGMSTFLFGRVAKDAGETKDGIHHGLHINVTSVDIDSLNVGVAQEVCKDLPVQFVVGDSVAYLRERQTPIDLLYLDSQDCNAEIGADNSGPQAHNKTEMLLGITKLSPKGILMMDDNDFENGGKTRMSNEYLRATGQWVQLWDGKQSIWVRK